MLSRGLAALTLILFFTTGLSAKFLYKDEVILDDNVTAELEIMGSELFEKTGIGLYVAVVKEFDANQTIVDYELELAKELPEPFVLVTLSEYDQKIDILTRPETLYQSFDKEQVLSPFPNSGTMIPFLSWRMKKATVSQKYGAAVQNGYIDIAGQIGSHKGVDLESVPEDTNKTIFTLLRIVFYGFIAYAIMMMIRNKFFRKKEDS